MEKELETVKTLFQVCRDGNLELLKEMVEAGSDINEDNQIALAIAAIKGHLDIVKYLIDEGITKNGRVLLGAASAGKLDIIKYLVEEVGYDVLYRHHTSAYVAFKRGNTEVLEYLLTKGCILPDQNIIDMCETGTTGSFKAAIMAKPELDLFIADGIYLITAAKHGHVDIVKYLIEAGYTMPARVIKEAFRKACKYGNLDTMTVLLKIMAEKNGLNQEFNGIAFLQAVNSGSVDKVKFLVKHGMIRTVKLTSRHLCTGYTSMVKYLVENDYVELDIAKLDSCINRTTAKGYDELTEYLESLKDDSTMCKQKAITIKVDEQLACDFKASCILVNKTMGEVLEEGMREYIEANKA